MESYPDRDAGSDRALSPGEPPPRPRPVEPLPERLAAWLAWVGLPRLVGTALCVAAVAGGAYWLVRTPAEATEATLTRATTVGAGRPAVVATTEGSAPERSEVVVHVAGEVRTPGVYLLVDDVRVHDAIEQAGGPTTDADLDALNLAAVLADGQRLYVPAAGEVSAGGEVPLVPPLDDAAGGSSGVDDGSPVDLNRASAAELDRLPGVGPATAQAIVDDREQNGPFARVDDLERVQGIGPTKLDALRGLVSV